MAIDSVNLYTVKIPRKYAFKTSQAAQLSSDSVFLEIFDSNYVGIGESVPRDHITGETLDGTFDLLENILNESVGKDVEELLTCLDEDISIPPSAKIALEMASYDLMSKKRDLPLYRILGTPNKTRIEYCGFMSSDVEGDKLLKKVNKSCENNYSMIRFKVGSLEFKRDLERLKLVRENFPNLGIWLDVNQAWDRDKAPDYFKKLEPLDIMMIEQPLDRDDFEGNKYIKQKSNIPIMLDESIVDEKTFYEALKCGADAVNLKYMKLGNFKRTSRLVKEAKEQELETYSGATTATDVFAAFNRHLEFAIPELDYFSTGKPRSQNFKENPTYPKLIYDGNGPYAKLPQNKIGIGINLNHEIFNQYVERRFSK